MTQPIYWQYPELENEPIQSVGGSCIPSKRFFQRNDEEKRWLNELRKDDDKWYKHLERLRDLEEARKENFHY